MFKVPISPGTQLFKTQDTKSITIIIYHIIIDHD